MNKAKRHAREYCNWVRAQADVGHFNTVPIRVLPGITPPTFEGDLHHYENKKGERISHPAAYAKKGRSSMVYRHSTLRVEVGADWLASKGIRTEMLGV